MRKKPVVISLGGSLIVPDGGIDVDFLKRFSAFIRKKITEKCWQFFIVVGGGATSRHYQKAAKRAGGRLGEEDIDWMGIYATHLNSQLMRIIFTDEAHLKIIDDYRRVSKRIRKPVVLAGGGKPGWSTDYDAVLLARDYRADMVLNLTDVKMVYDKDPKKYRNAKPIKKISWRKFRQMIDDKWISGMNIPFDPVASKLAEKIGIKVIVLNGRDLKNLERLLEEKEFVGTIIE